MHTQLDRKGTPLDSGNTVSIRNAPRVSVTHRAGEEEKILVLADGGEAMGGGVESEHVQGSRT